MSGFNQRTNIQLSMIHNPSYRLSKFGHIEYETVLGALSFKLTLISAI